MFHTNHKKLHLLQKLTNREINGSFIRQRRSNSQSLSACRLFKDIPSRCTYQLSNVIDLPGNHVFMGSTRCGQFLLTYSFITHANRLSQQNKYQLHWWVFRPGQQAAKVAEVQLFADYAVTNILTIGIAQWPNVNNKLVVYGFCNNDEDYAEEDHRRYYLTITTLPSLNDCRDCKSVAASFDEEDMAANWDTCVSFSCLKHGLTIHTLFDVTPPYPKFDFNISLKLNNSVVFNTVNFLHVLSVDFESPKPERQTKTEQTIVTEEINHRVGQMMTFKYPQEYALPYDINKAFKSGQTFAKHLLKQPLPPPLSSSQPTPRTAPPLFHTKEKSSRQWCIRIPNLAMKPVSTRTKVWRRSIIDQAEKVYAFEESEDGGCEPKFKWYRRKRLADKMYEFCSDEDEDMENIRPPDKSGIKLPRYKCLSPPKTSPEKSDPDGRLQPSETGFNRLESIQQPFTKMFLNFSGNEMRFHQNLIQNSDCYKRLSNKTDSDSEIRNELMKSNTEPEAVTSDMKSNFRFRLDESASDKVRCSKDIEKPVTIQIPPITLPLCDEKNVDKNAKNVSEGMFLSPAVVSDNKKDVSVDLSSSVKTLESGFISGINHDVRAIIADWEADSISSMSPQSEFSSSVSVTNCNSPKVLDFMELVHNEKDMERHCTIQKFLEIPTKSGVTSKNLKNHYCGSSKVFSTNLKSFDDTSMKTILMSNSIKDNVRGGLKPPQFPPIKLRALKPHNRIRRFKRKESCLIIDKDDEMKKKRDIKVMDDKVKSSEFEDEFVDILDNILGNSRSISDCSIQLDRRFIEVDEEMISTITDIEDDDQTVGFHCALPLYAHGSAYAQMQMVSNHKVDKLNVPCLLVRQNSLDIEQLCSKAAEVICECEGFKFWFCDDYDTEIVDVCPLDGSILIVVFMRLNVERVHAGAFVDPVVVVDRRHFYECKCLFIWSTERQDCRLEAYTHLSAVPSERLVPDNWSPARREAERMRERAEAGFFHIRPTPAIRAFVHSLYDDDDNQTDSALEIQDPTNLMLFRLYPVNSSVKIDSDRIVVL